MFYYVRRLLYLPQHVLNDIIYNDDVKSHICLQRMSVHMAKHSINLIN